MNAKDKTYWIMLIFILAGLIIGGLIGDIASGVPALSFLGMGKSIGVENPINLNLGFMNLVLGFTFNLNLASFLGLIISLLLYKWLIR